MKITHVVLSGLIADNLSYQEDLLAKYHRKLGYDVSIITTKYVFGTDGEITVDKRKEYINKNDVKVIRLNNIFNTDYKSKFKRFENVYETLETENPDILFVHGVQFLDIKEIVKYIKENPTVKVYVDNHADFSNSAINWLSKNILHKKIWRKTAQLIEPYTTKFYGVLPARVDFLEKMYDIQEEKLELLVMGADDEKVEFASQTKPKIQLREKYNIQQDDFLIVTGGKIDKAKRQVLNLMKAVAKLNDSRVKLIVYGSVIPEMQEQVNHLAQNKYVEYIGWINNDQSYQLFSAADLVVFPGRHSVYWEQVVAMGTPMVVKYWEGTTHIDIGGNCKYLYEDTEEELIEVLRNILYNENTYYDMLQNAQGHERKKFLYSHIAEKSVK